METTVESAISMFTVENVAILVAFVAMGAVIKILWRQHVADTAYIRDELTKLVKDLSKKQEG